MLATNAGVMSSGTTFSAPPACCRRVLLARRDPWPPDTDIIVAVGVGGERYQQQF
jgi:hypothetical protein